MTRKTPQENWKRATGSDLPTRSTFDKILWFVLVAEMITMCAGTVFMGLSLVVTVLVGVFYREAYDVEIENFPLPFKIMAGVNLVFLLVIAVSLLAG